MDVVTFELPAHLTTSAELRDLEQNAPNVTPKAIRAALVSAAKIIEEHEKKATNAVRILEEALNLRAGQMASQARCDEVERAIKNAMNQAIFRLR